MRSVVPIHSAAEVVPLGRFDLHDLETIRLVLRGSSVVDWVSLHFRAQTDIDAFLRVNELNPADPSDQIRLLSLKSKAIQYLSEHLGYRVPEAIRDSQAIHPLFEWASQTRGRRAYRLHACMVLKVMHIIHHAEAQELFNMLPLSQAELAVLLHGKIERVVRGLIERRFPLVIFNGNQKTPYSVLTKLLAKKDTQSAQVFDKLRFRFVVERREDIPSLILALSRELVPFNYLVPLQTHNSLIDLDRMLVRAGNDVAIKSRHDPEINLNEDPVDGLSDERRNEFSGPDYRVVSFVSDIPVRVDRILSLRAPKFQALGSVVFGAVEFQLVDRRTEQQNESGANRHRLYKARQRARVRERLERGKRKKREKPALVLEPVAGEGLSARLEPDAVEQSAS